MLYVLAQVSVRPDGGALPGTAQIQNLVNGIAMWSLLAALAGVVIGAAAWALSSRAGHGGGVAGGRTAVVMGAGAALIIGAAAGIINFFFNVGRGIG